MNQYKNLLAYKHTHTHTYKYNFYYILFFFRSIFIFQIKLDRIVSKYDANFQLKINLKKNIKYLKNTTHLFPYI